MSMIINIQNKGYEQQSHRAPGENWNGAGWLSVPAELEPAVAACAPWCELEIGPGPDGVDVLLGVTPLERPRPEPEPTVEEQLRADIDFIAVMMGVEL